MTTTSTRVCIAEDFLSMTAGTSNKGYVLRIYKVGERSYELYTNYGPLSTGMTRNANPTKTLTSESAARTAYDRIL